VQAVKRAVLKVVLALALIGGILMWLRAPPAHRLSATSNEALPAIERSPSHPQMALESPRPTSPAPNSTPAKPNVLDRLNIAPNSVGSFTRRSRFDFEWYVVMASVGAFVERNDTPMASMFQDMYDLSSEDLKSVIDYALSTIQSDRAFQATERRRLCMRRAEFQSLDALGQALNEADRNVEANQERLGRGAEGALNAVTFSKINTEMAKRPPGDVTVTDFTALFAAQNPDLGEEIGRLCDNAP
jgi:hypothetical protein